MNFSLVFVCLMAIVLAAPSQSFGIDKSISAGASIGFEYSSKCSTFLKWIGLCHDNDHKESEEKTTTEENMDETAMLIRDVVELGINYHQAYRRYLLATANGSPIIVSSEQCSSLKIISELILANVHQDMCMQKTFDSK